MGQVAHVSVYDFALSQSQVAFLHSLYDIPNPYPNPDPNPNPNPNLTLTLT